MVQHPPIKPQTYFSTLQDARVDTLPQLWGIVDEEGKS